MSTEDPALNETLLANLDEVVSDLDMSPPAVEKAAVPIADRRRRRRRRVDPKVGMLSIVDRDGVLYIDDAAPRPQLGGVRRRRARALGLGGTVLKRVPFERLDPSQVSTALKKLDDKLTPNQGLREWTDWTPRPARRARRSGRILLVVHGTFSNTDHLLAELDGTEPGRALRRDIAASYDQVLTFDHPTLGVSPLLNARELAVCMDDTPAHVDVVCHSRGGLVTRWWLEALDGAAPDRRRVIFVGSPLAGTSLAAPPRLRASLNFLANVSKALGAATGAASAAVPFLAVATGIFRVVSSVTRFTAKTPLIDAAVAMVPGLAAMSRVGNNQEMLSLRRPPIAPDGRYFVVKSDFEPPPIGWRFWRVFCEPKKRIVDLGADLVFDDANDLVVNTGSMSNFENDYIVPKSQIHDFGRSHTVHHMNYFRQKATVEFIRRKLLTAT